jgi:hypothetical protein
MDLSKLFGLIAILNLLVFAIYFLFRFLYFGSKTSYTAELQDIVSFKYFDKIKGHTDTKNKDMIVIKVLNVCLVAFYFLILVLIILGIITVTQNELRAIN